MKRQIAVLNNAVIMIDEMRKEMEVLKKRNAELEEDSICSIMEHTAEDRKNDNTKFYNLDAIIAIGY